MFQAGYTDCIILIHGLNRVAYFACSLHLILELHFQNFGRYSATHAPMGAAYFQMNKGTARRTLRKTKILIHEVNGCYNRCNKIKYSHIFILYLKVLDFNVSHRQTFKQLFKFFILTNTTRSREADYRLQCYPDSILLVENFSSSLSSNLN